VRRAPIVLLTSLATAIAGAAGDAQRGEALFESQKCVVCHSISGKGGTTGPDLGRGFARGYSPAVMASLMWNHAPAMWASMKAQGIERPDLTADDAADLFAFFFSARYFERPGDAGRGKQVFATKRCNECHGVGTEAGKGKPVSSWQSLADPIVLVQQMWNHAGEMKKAMEGTKLGWVQLTTQDLIDLLVYLQNLPPARHVSRTLVIPSVDRGEMLFEARGCQSCHQGKLALDKRLANRTLTDIAVAMWNHAPRMMNAPLAIESGEMRQIIAYVWAQQFFESGGNAALGRRLFTAKHCATCHTDLKLKRGPGVHSAISMVGVLWQHGPQMFATMEQKKVGWPRLGPADMSDLIAYLNTRE
jgi:cytochrome c2